jgi:hypothetical protein
VGHLRDELDAMDETGHECLHCGGRERVAIFEVWEGGEFMLETCCEGLHETITEEMNRDPEYAAALLRELEVDQRRSARSCAAWPMPTASSCSTSIRS